MPKSGKIVLNLVDAYGRNLEESVDISLKPQGPGEKRFFKGRDAKKRLRISRPQGLYRLHIDPPSYLPIHRFIQMPPSGETTRTISFAVDPQKVVKVNIPKYTTLAPEIKTLLAASKSVRPYGTNSGAKLYKLLDNPRKAGFFNIVAKAKNTFFSNGKTVFDHILQLTELRGDRFFAVVDQELEVDIKNSVADDLFHEASDALHDPPEGFDKKGSFKTDDRYGNLQVSLFAKEGEWRADIDIDDAGGLEHVFQVARNTLTGRPTHPYDIHEILLIHQGINPGYEFSL